MSRRDAAPDPQFLAVQEALAGRYSLERELGRGGMGVVYLAREVRLDRPVALKLLPPELAGQPVFRERFLQEARTAAQLSHPHIVPVHAVDEVGDLVFFAMAFVEGETLGERVRQRGPLPPAQAARVLKEVAWALGYAHAQGVIHRDVKPDNIMLEAETGRAVVTDFGIARVAQSTRGLTGSAEILGTAEFMSPEQASGEAVDGRSDLYALGVVGHYALSGTLPFQGETVAATLAQHLTRPAPPVRAVAPEVPAGLASALDRCLAKEPAARFDQAGDLAAAIEESLGRKEAVPAAIRLFQEEAHDQPVGMALFTAYGLSILGMTVGLALTGEPLVTTLPFMALGGLIAATPVGMLIRKARRLLRSGYGLEDLTRALGEEVDEGRRAIVLARGGGEPTRLDRWLLRVSKTGLTLWTGGFVWLGWGPYVESEVLRALFGVTMVGLPVVSLGAALWSILRGNARRKVRGERWLRFWRNRVGRAIFRLAGIGVDAGRGVTGQGYRPTAVAIGMAADRLFKDLPMELRREFASLPSVVRALEEDADRIRGQVRKLDAARAEVGGSESDVAREIARARTAAEARLAEVVGALESLRVQLIKMQAGIGSVTQLTEHLGAAEAVAAAMAEVVAGMDQVNALLAHPRDPDHARRTTPAGA